MENFKEEIKINNKTVLNIPLENYYYEDEIMEFKTDWKDKVKRVKKE